ncbi:hypothetical protein [Aliihoeflea aestuarii]|nr:hypothetical protein [Aliihoeflea aestuarii]
MEKLFGKPGYRRFTLQDRKRLPARFYARVSGAISTRAAAA